MRRLLSFFMLLPLMAAAQRITPAQYIEKYKHLAIDDMRNYGIPASVKMAQAMLESDCGNSRLATEGNNHFGIKCKSTWKGNTIAHDDDSPGECFRSYKTAEESFSDHAQFIRQSTRYERLFALDIMDYKAWAQGLKDCGYATSPVYPQRLIKMIETHKLYELDTLDGALTASTADSDLDSGALTYDDYTPLERERITIITAPDLIHSAVEQGQRDNLDADDYAISTMSAGGRPVYHNNGSEFVVAHRGDTYESLAAATRINSNKLRNYNDAESSEMQPREGEFVYLRAKPNKALNGRVMHTAAEGETLRDVAQHYGIRTAALERLNRMRPGHVIAKGQQIRLM